jgi:hypothetical protein
MVEDTPQSLWPGVDVRQEVCRLFRARVNEPWTKQGRPGALGVESIDGVLIMTVPKAGD